jgi:hypothetical protein
MAGEKPKSTEPTDPGMGQARGGPSRERTVLGVGLSAPAASSTAAAPVVVVGHLRERTVLGVAPAAKPAGLNHLTREASLQEPPADGWDLVEPEPRKPSRAEASASAREPSIAVDLSELDSASKEPSLIPAGVPRHRGRKWLLVFVVVSVAAAAGYLRREQLVPLLHRLQERFVTATRGLVSEAAEGSGRCPGRASPDAGGEPWLTDREGGVDAQPGLRLRRLPPPARS